MNKQEWTAALHSFVEEQRKSHLLLNQKDLSTEEDWQRRIIGSEFINWYNNRLEDILNERAALRMQFDPAPLIVFTTNTPGVVAAQDILQEAPENIIFLLHNKFSEWEKQHPFDTFRFHIHHWSYFQNINQQSLERAKTLHPDINPNDFRIHTTGVLWGENCGMQCDHLWHWSGEKMIMLEEAFSHLRY